MFSPQSLQPCFEAGFDKFLKDLLPLLSNNSQYPTLIHYLINFLLVLVLYDTKNEIFSKLFLFSNGIMPLIGMGIFINSSG